MTDPRLPTDLPLFSSIDLISIGSVTGSDLIPPIYDWCTNEYYYTEGECLIFSCPDTRVRIWYHALPNDCSGYPLIPDDEALKQATYWYIRMKIIETGYHDPVFKWERCQAEYDKYLSRAIEHFLTDDMDTMDRKVDNIHGHDYIDYEIENITPSHKQPQMWIPLNSRITHTDTSSQTITGSGFGYEDVTHYSDISPSVVPRLIYVESDERNNYDASTYIHTGTEIKFLQTVTR